jgi:hypothetical protein
LPIRFMDKLINCFTAKGLIVPAVRCEAPFADISTSSQRPRRRLQRRDQ